MLSCYSLSHSTTSDIYRLLPCLQMFWGLQGNPQTGGHGGGYSDGERGSLVKQLLFKIHFPDFHSDFFLFLIKVATDVIKEFAADNVKYLELRSTPREENHTSTNRKDGFRYFGIMFHCLESNFGLWCFFYSRTNKKELHWDSD